VLPRKGPGTQQSYDGHLRWWRRRLGSTPLADLRASQILVHRDRLARHKSSATVNRYLASLSAVLSAAMLDWEWLEASSMARVRALPEPRGRVRYLSDAERPRLLQAVQASQARRCLAAHLAHAERSLARKEHEGHNPRADATPTAV
jgi:integrase